MRRVSGCFLYSVSPLPTRSSTCFIVVGASVDPLSFRSLAFNLVAMSCYGHLSSLRACSQLIGPMVLILDEQRCHTRLCSLRFRVRVCHQGGRAREDSLLIEVHTDVGW